MATLQASASFAGRSFAFGLFSMAVTQVFKPVQSLLGVGQLTAPLVPPSGWFVDINTAFQGVVGGSAPPFPVGDDEPVGAPYNQTSGVSAAVLFNYS